MFLDLLKSSTPVNITVTQHNSNGNFSPVIVSPLKRTQSCTIQKNRYNQEDGLGHSNIVTDNDYGSAGFVGIDTPGPANTFPMNHSNSNEVMK